jgi:hypothetical protein
VALILSRLPQDELELSDALAPRPGEPACYAAVVVDAQFA